MILKGGLTPFLLLSTLLTMVSATNHFVGIGASNAIGGVSPFACRTQQQWNTLANNAKNSGFKSIRIFAFDCNALDLASAAASSAGLNVLAGILYSGTVASSASSIDNDVQTFKNAVKKYGSGRYIGLAVGNEATDSPANIMAKVNQVRASLRASGINTPVSTVHTWVNIRANTILCQADFVGANAHAFYDGHVTASQAGDFVFKTVIPALRAACPGKRIMITESGWPSQGLSNGAAVASQSNEQQALQSLNCANRNDTGVLIFAFEYDDQVWKSNDNERSFGILGKISLTNALASC